MLLCCLHGSLFSDCEVIFGCGKEYSTHWDPWEQSSVPILKRVQALSARPTDEGQTAHHGSTMATYCPYWNLLNTPKVISYGLCRAWRSLVSGMGGLLLPAAAVFDLAQYLG